MFKRALIAVALTSTFAVPAFADVTISGSAEMDIFVRNHQSGSGGTAFLNETDLITNFDGSDKLDYGDKLIWRISQKVCTDCGNPTPGWGSREAYIGLTGDWGTFRSGRVFAPSYLALDAFQWGAGNLWEDYGANGVFFQEAVAYSTPDLGGFGAQIAYDFGNKTVQGQTWALDAILTYNGNGLNLAGGYQQQKGINTGNGLNLDDVYVPGGDTGIKQEFYFAQGNWDIGNGFTIRGGWKHNKWTNDTVTGGNINATGAGTAVAYGSAENDQFLVAGAYSWGKNSFAVGWQDIVNSKLNGQSNNDYNLNQVFGQYTYGLSKNTVAYLQGRYQRFDDSNTRPFASATWQIDGIEGTGTSSGARVLIGTWTGF